MYITLLVWDAESLWITLSKTKLLMSQGVTPFICRVVNHRNTSLTVALLCHIPSSQPVQLEGSNKTNSPNNTNQQSTISKQKQGQVHPLAKIKLSSHLGNSSYEICTTTNPSEQGTENEVHNAKPQEHWQLRPVKAHSTFTYKPQSRLLWVLPLKRVNSCRKSSLKRSSWTFKMHQN